MSNGQNIFIRQQERPLIESIYLGLTYDRSEMNKNFHRLKFMDRSRRNLMKRRLEVIIEHCNEFHLDPLKAFQLPEEQAKFTALPIEILEEAQATSSQYPIVILAEGSPAGFFVLHDDVLLEEHSDNDRALLLMAFSINEKEQGKGIATKAMEEVQSFVGQAFPGKNEIVLGVNHKNMAAQHVYRKAGFHDTGRRKMGRNGEIFIFSVDL